MCQGWRIIAVLWAFGIILVDALAAPPFEHYSLDGAGNNLAHHEWGARMTPQRRRLGFCYADGVSAPRFVMDPANPNSTLENYNDCVEQCRAQQVPPGGTWSYVGLQPFAVDHRPLSCAYGCNDLLGANIRTIANRIYSHLRRRQLMNAKKVNSLHTFWGQLMCHEMSYTHAEGESWPIPVPQCDAWWDPTCTGVAKQAFSRCTRAPGTGTSTDAPLEPMNYLSSWIDGNMIYGGDREDPAVFNVVRNGNASDSAYHSCKLKTIAKPESISSDGWQEFYDVPEDPRGYLLLDAGAVDEGSNTSMTNDYRGNYGPGGLSLITIFTRLHNKECDRLKGEMPHAGPEELFWQARKWVIAYMQKVHYYEYIPTLLGKTLPGYEGYVANEEPALDPYTTVAASRFGHSEVNEVFLRLDRNWELHTAGSIPLRDAMLNTARTFDAGLDPVLRGLMAQLQGRVDSYFVDNMVNVFATGEHQLPQSATWGEGHCMAQAGIDASSSNGKLDIQSRMIRRGRDVGLCGINTARAGMNLPPYADWKELVLGPNWSSVPENAPGQRIAADLEQMYGLDVDNADFIVAGFAEHKAEDDDSTLGPTFGSIVADEWDRLRRTDRFYFERPGMFTSAELTKIMMTSLSDIIKETTDISDVPSEAFVVPGEQVDRPNASGDVRLPEFAEYEHRKLLSPNFKMAWSNGQLNASDKETKFLDIAVAAPTLGWVGVGFSITNGTMHPMQRCDVTVGRIYDGNVTVEDMFMAAILAPIRDVDRVPLGKDDLSRTGVVQENGVTTVFFRKPVRSADQWDINLNTATGKLNVAFAYQPHDKAELDYHAAARGLVEVQLFEPECAAGTYLETVMFNCVPCKRGAFRQPWMLLTSCERCPMGTFQPDVGSSECIPCYINYTDHRTTLVVGAISAEECVCPHGARMTRSGNTSACVPCEEGLSCPAGTEEPSQLEGYNAEVLSRDPLTYSIWRCPIPGACPGGPLGSCAGGTEGRMCLACQEPSTFWSTAHRMCVQCEESNGGWMMLGALVLAAVTTAALYFMSMNIGDDDAATDPLELGVGMALLLFLGQSCSVFSRLDIPWESPLREFLHFAAALVLDLNMFDLECSLGFDDFSRYCFGVCMMGMFMFVLALMSVCLRRCKRHRDAPLYCWNALGVVFHAFFIAILLHGTAPFLTLAHPNGRRTAQGLPAVIVGSEEYPKFATMGALHLIIYAGGFLSYAAFACLQLRARAKRRTARGIRTVLWHRFLYIKFRPSRYYWSVVQMIRSVALAFIPVIFHEPHTQIILLQLVLCISACLQAYFWPYRNDWYNFGDIAACIALMSLSLAAAFFLHTESHVYTSVVTTSVSVAFIVCIVLFGGLSVFTLGLFLRRRFMSAEELRQLEEAKLKRRTAFYADLQCVSGKDLEVLEAECRFVDVDAVCQAPIPPLTSAELLILNGSIPDDPDFPDLTDEELAQLEPEFIPPSEHYYMMKLQQTMRVLEDRLRWRIQEHMDGKTGRRRSLVGDRLSRSNSCESVMRGEICRLDQRTYSTVLWNMEEQAHVAKLSAKVVEFLAAYVQVFRADPVATRILKLLVNRMERKFWGVYQACVKDILSVQAGFATAIGMATMLDKLINRDPDILTESDTLELKNDSWCELMHIAVRTQEAVWVYAKALAEATGGHITRTAIKRLYRILEKNSLDRKIWEGGPMQAWDTARMMIVYDTMGDLARGVERLYSDHQSGRVEVVRVKERFTSPTSGGWSDILVNLRFPPQCKVLSRIFFELQLVHTQMLVIRKEMGGHAGYGKYRSAKEILEFLGADAMNGWGAAVTKQSSDGSSNGWEAAVTATKSKGSNSTTRSTRPGLNFGWTPQPPKSPRGERRAGSFNPLAVSSNFAAILPGAIGGGGGDTKHLF